MLRSFPAANESSLQITVAQGILKDRKMDGLVRQLTELGVSRWVPFIAERSVPRPDAQRFQARKKRWEKIAREAVKQCRRGRIPDICDLRTFEEMLALGTASDLRIVFWENETEPVRLSDFPETGVDHSQAFIVLGPEGGLTNAEIALAKSRGFITAALGPRILKSDTATVTACVIVQYLFGDMGQKNLDKNRGV